MVLILIYNTNPVLGRANSQYLYRYRFDFCFRVAVGNITSKIKFNNLKIDQNKNVDINLIFFFSKIKEFLILFQLPTPTHQAKIRMFVVLSNMFEVCSLTFVTTFFQHINRHRHIFLDKIPKCPVTSVVWQLFDVV